MWTDGTHVVRLTFGTLAATQPAFSPDGSKIAFVRWTGPGTSVIAVMNRDGSALTSLSPDGGQAFAPAWSPDGTKLVFGSSHATPNIPVLYTMTAAGGALTAITATNGAFYPVGKAAWSPAGTRIAYSSVQSNGAPTLTMINPDGSNRTTLSSSSDTDPVWSADGAQLLFTTLASGTSQLARIQADGTGRTTLTTGPATYAQSAW
jgi:TolB protein